MPARVDNIVIEQADETSELTIVSNSGSRVVLTIDKSISTMVRGQQWIWCKTLQRCYTLRDGKRWYLTQFVAEMHGAKVRHVRFKNGNLDFRLSSLDIRYATPRPQCRTLPSLPMPLNKNHAACLSGMYENAPAGVSFIGSLTKAGNRTAP